MIRPLPFLSVWLIREKNTDPWIVVRSLEEAEAVQRTFASTDPKPATSGKTSSPE